MNQEIYKNIIEKIKNSRTIAIFMHNSPDGDCIGSAVALEELCKKLGKRTDLIIQDKIPKKYSPIVGSNRVNKVITPHEGKMYDLAILVDCADSKRTVNNLRRYAKFLIVLDHHKVSKPFGDIYLYEPVAATGIIVYKIIKQFSELSPTICNAIYCTILCDTSNFSNRNIDSETHSVCADLLKHGADIDIINQIYQIKTKSFLMLLGSVLQDIEIDAQYGIVSLIIHRDSIKNANAFDHEASMIINYITNIEDCDISFLFIEGINNVRISGRSNTKPVRPILEHFGGGGHDNASGCAIDGKSINYAASEVLEYARNYLNSIK